MMKFKQEQLRRILTGLGMAMAGAMAVAALQYLSTLDFGVYTPFVVAITSAGINALRVGASTPRE